MLFFNDTDSLRAVLAESGKGNLILVKDCGIYLIAERTETDGTDCIKHVTYAEDCHPERDGSWYETARRLAGGDDFSKRFTINDFVREQLLSGEKQLRIILTGEKLVPLYGEKRCIELANYQSYIGQMIAMRHLYFKTCTSNEELKNWRSAAIALLSEAAFISCDQAISDDHLMFTVACSSLHRHLNCVSPDGALRLNDN